MINVASTRNLYVDVTLRSYNLSLLYYNYMYYYRCVAHKLRNLPICVWFSFPNFAKQRYALFFVELIEKSILHHIQYIKKKIEIELFHYILHSISISFYFDFTWSWYAPSQTIHRAKTNLVRAPTLYIESYYTRWLLTGLCLFSV